MVNWFGAKTVGAVREMFESSLAEVSSAAFDQDFRALGDFIREQSPGLAGWLAEHSDAIQQRLFRVEHKARFAVFISKLTGSQTSREAFDLLRLLGNCFSGLVRMRG